MKWEVPGLTDESKGHHLGRRCTKCKDSGGSGDTGCKCGSGGTCSPGKDCKCALAGKCCKCCCTSCSGCKKDAKCSCIEKESEKKDLGIYVHKETYQSAYISYTNAKHFEKYGMAATWNALHKFTANFGSIRGNPTEKRSQCAQTLLGSVCLIWSGITYMYWTGKYHSSSPRWNNHILDGSGLDDGTLSQWLQALGFPKEVLNNSGPQNRLDKVIWDGIMDKLYLGFPDTGTWKEDRVHGNDVNANTFRDPAGMNYAGYIHTVDRGAFCSNATVFRNGDGSSTSEENINKCGALYKLYILSCAYFTGLQKKTPPQADNKTPKTIREILYWLSALPYSPAYQEILTHSKEVLKEVAPDVEDKKQLSFYQTGRNHPITVHEFNLFAHFQAVTQYCPLVLIGIQGGLHSPKDTDSTTEPAIHSLYANTECSFTYPAVPIQAYNQVVHYIRALFYQLYFLRKQCAVKVTCGGKWRECRYGEGVVSKGVISWMCLGCNPMEHDRKWRVGKVGDLLKGVKESDAKKIKELLEKIGEVVVQLGNAQEALEGKEKKAIEGVKKALEGAKGALESAKDKLNGVLNGKLDEAKDKLGELTKNGSGGSKGILKDVEDGLGKVTSGEYDPGKNKISEAIKAVREALEALKKELDDSSSSYLNGRLSQWVINEFTKTIEQIKEICNSPKCPGCTKHGDKCGQPSNPTVCPACLQPTTTGVPSPLQAFLEDRLPGFSCEVVRNDEKDNPVYPPAASHLGHCNGSGQCCPLPMGFRNQFYSGIRDCTGQRLYGILYFFSNENMMQSCVYTLVRVTAALSATTPQVLGDVFGFFRGGVGNKEKGKTKKNPNEDDVQCNHQGDLSKKKDTEYFCGWCASGLRDVVKQIEWI